MMSVSTLDQNWHSYIGGRWQQGMADSVTTDTNPFNGQTLCQLREVSLAQVDLAYQHAQQSQRDWAAMATQERLAIIDNAAQLWKDHQGEIINWAIDETGATINVANVLFQFAWEALKTASQCVQKSKLCQLPCPNHQTSMVYRKPIGVVSLITPWNAPLNLTMRTLAPALALGNSVVLKPASDTPICGGLLHAKIFEKAGLPAGVLNVIVGSGERIGQAMVAHPLTRYISFSGSTEVGRSILTQTAISPTMKRVGLELGGNCPCVVLDDADVDKAAQSVLMGRLLHQGQICMSVNRVIVDQHRHDAFVDCLLEKVKNIRCGDPYHHETLVGPIINRKAYKNLLAKIQRAKEEGATHLWGEPASFPIIPPQLFTNIDPHNELAQTETFGPLLPIIRANDEAHALQIANDTQYGLSAAVWSQDHERAQRFAEKVESGMCHINHHTVLDQANAPFGGVKNSGFGRFNGQWAIEELTELQWITEHAIS